MRTITLLLGQEKSRVARDCALSIAASILYGNVISRWNSFDDENEQDGRIEDLLALELSLIIKTDVLFYRWKEGCDVPFNIISTTLRAIFAHRMFQSITCIEKSNEKRSLLKGTFLHIYLGRKLGMSIAELEMHARKHACLKNMAR